MRTVARGHGKGDRKLEVSHDTGGLGRYSLERPGHGLAGVNSTLDLRGNRCEETDVRIQVGHGGWSEQDPSLILLMLG